MKVERKHILDIGIINPMVHDVLRAWQHGYYNFEEAMMRAVIMLEKQNREMTKQLGEQIKNHE